MALVERLLGPVVVALTVGMYSGSLRGSFVYDDLKCIVENPQVTQPFDLQAILTHDYWGMPLASADSHKSFRPLTIAAFWLTHRCFGLDPRFFHAVNVAVQAVVALLFVQLSRLVFCGGRPTTQTRQSKGPKPHEPTTGGQLQSVAVVASSLLFTLHPMHSEAVSNITNLGELLSLMFQLLAFLGYANAVRSASAAQGVLAVAVLPALAVLCKEMGIMVLPLMAAWDATESGLVAAIATFLFPSARTAETETAAAVAGKKRKGAGRRQRQPSVAAASSPDAPAARGVCLRGLARIVGLAAVSVALMAVRLWWQGKPPEWFGPTNPAANEDAFLTRFLSFSYLDYFHFRMLAWPFRFCPDYRSELDVSVVKSLSDPRAPVGVAFVLAVVAFSLYLLWLFARPNARPRATATTIAWAWMVLPFLPAANLFFFVGFVAAERVTFSPSVGFCLLFGVLASHCYGRWRAPSLLALALVLCVCGATLLHRDAQWANDESLWRSATEHCPNNFVSWVLLGNVFSKADRHAEAITAFKRSLALHPHYYHANLNLGRSLREVGQTREAIAFFRTSLLSCGEPSLCAHAYNAIGICHQELHEYGESAEAFGKAHGFLPSNPRFAALRDQMQSLAKQTGRQPQAQSAQDPAQPDAALDSAFIAKLASIASDQELASLAVDLSRQKRFAEAVKCLEKAVSITGGNAELFHGLAAALTESGRLTEASDALARAATIKPTVQYLSLYGASLAAAGDVAKSKALFLDAFKRYPDSVQLPYELGVVLMNAKDEAARQFFEHALEMEASDTISKSFKSKGLVNIGVLEYQSGNTETAMRRFKEALAFDASNVNARNNHQALAAALDKATEATGV